MRLQRVRVVVSKILEKALWMGAPDIVIGYGVQQGVAAHLHEETVVSYWTIQYFPIGVNVNETLTEICNRAWDI
jgi:hypothetical protein